MRMLEDADIEYKPYEYEWDESDLSGLKVAAQIDLPVDMVFKTLAARGDKTGVVVFCIPVACELDLKKAAKQSGNKKVELLHVKELPSVTGYVRGGCSPIGMKKKYPVFFDETAILFDSITISAGIRGCQLLVNTEKLVSFLEGKLCPLTME